ncbi:MAG: RNA polymerase sigma factor [Pirellulaceae bacterium]
MPEECEPESDIELLRRYREGDSFARERVVGRLLPLVSKLASRLTCWHEESQDIVQEVFLAMQKSAESFRGNARLETWATSITLNCCRQWTRLQQQKRRVHARLRRDGTTQDESARRAEQDLVVQEELRMALAGLSEDQRELIVLRYFEALSVDRIAEHLGVRKNVVEVRLVRARKRLQKILNARGIYGVEV